MNNCLRERRLKIEKSALLLGLILFSSLFSLDTSGINIVNADPSDPTPGYRDTSRYLIGSVAVGIIFIESDGSIDPSTEDWSDERMIEVNNKIQNGLSWLASQNPRAHVSFVYDIHTVYSSYEPINHASTDRNLWMSEALTRLGFPEHGQLDPNTAYMYQNLYYLNDLRVQKGTDWAFSIWVYDSFNDVDGSMTDGNDALAVQDWSYLFLTYDNDGYGIENMDCLVAHETCHLFGASEEYDEKPENRGYLWVQDSDYPGFQPVCVMNENSWVICENTRQQIGWRDTDGDGIPDIVDTYPVSMFPVLGAWYQDSKVFIAGVAFEMPFPSAQPGASAVTINTISSVMFRVGSGNWQTAVALDGAFDQVQERFAIYLDVTQLTQEIEVSAVNSVGNIEGIGVRKISLSSVDSIPPTTTLSIGTPQYTDGSAKVYVTSSTPLTLDATDGETGVASTEYKIYNASYSTEWITYSLQTAFYLAGLNDGVYSIDFKSADNAGNGETAQTRTVILDNSGPVITVENPPSESALQDGVNFIVNAIDQSGVQSLKFSVREADSGQGKSVGFENLLATYNDETKKWNLSFNTLQLPDGFYIVIVDATDNLGNTGLTTVPYSIRNWAVLELLPSSENNKAGRTMPVKFSLRVAASVDPSQPFVYNEDLDIMIYTKALPGNTLLQTSKIGTTSTSYRIDTIGEKYITNFKTLSTPATYLVEVYRNDFRIDGFEFRTIK